MKRITVKYREFYNEMYKKPFCDKEMRVVKSNHPRFSEGTRFDFGFMQIANEEGYEIILLPQ